MALFFAPALSSLAVSASAAAGMAAAGVALAPAAIIGVAAGSAIVAFSLFAKRQSKDTKDKPDRQKEKSDSVI